jgi:hypothetical protein
MSLEVSSLGFVIAWGSGFVRVQKILTWSDNCILYAFLNLKKVKFVLFLQTCFFAAAIYLHGLVFYARIRNRNYKENESEFASIYTDFEGCIVARCKRELEPRMNNRIYIPKVYHKENSY